jgi:hypothetical protein
MAPPQRAKPLAKADERFVAKSNKAVKEIEIRCPVGSEEAGDGF